MADYAFCPECKKKGRVKRISPDQMMEFGMCPECFEKLNSQGETDQVAEDTIEQEVAAPQEADVANDDGTSTEVKAKKGKAPKAPKPPKEPKPEVPRQPCACGCGGFPKSAKAKYLPGHDAKHHAAMKKAAKEAEEAAKKAAEPVAEATE